MSQTVRSSIFRPLHSWETRLLKLMPGDYETSLQCELHVAAITVDKGLGIASEVETVEYDALSYSWGRPELTASIECGGIEFFIPPTAAEGLRQLRSNLHPRWLWCDTICINQEDAREKASQVSHMFTVFVKARKVIGWLGREDPDTSLLVAAVKNALLTGIYEGKGMIAPLPDEPSGPESAKDQELSDIVTRLLARPWFSRTWIRQEVFAATELELQIGNQTIAWISLLGLLRSRFPGVMTEQVKALARHQLGDTSSHTGRYGGGRFRTQDFPFTEHFYELLGDGINFDASDDRDRVYAMFGMMDQSVNYSQVSLQHFQSWTRRFPVDYTISIGEVYQKLVKLLINTDRTLMCLEHLRPGGSAGEDSPSWAINWSCKAPANFSRLHELPNFMLSYDLKDKPATAVMPAQLQSIEADGELRLRGIRLGQLHTQRVDELLFLSLLNDLFNHPENGYYHYRNLDWPFVENLVNMNYEEPLCFWNVSTRTKDANADPQRTGVITIPAAREGDIVTWLHGGRSLHILRPAPKAGSYTLISSGWLYTARLHPNLRSVLFSSGSSLGPLGSAASEFEAVLSQIRSKSLAREGEELFVLV